MKSIFENEIKKESFLAIKRKIFPGCVIGIIKNNQKIVLPFGQYTYDSNSPEVHEDSIYDVASITKSIPTATLALKLIEDGKLKLSDSVSKFIPEFSHPEVLIKHLLTFTVIFKLPPLSDFKNQTADEILSAIFKAPLVAPPGGKYAYTNAPSILLSLIIEKVSGKPIDIIADEIFFNPLHMDHTTFHPLEFSKNQIVPTEYDPWRGKLIHGEIHDESSYVLRQKFIVGSAGLFSTVPDLLKFMQMLLSKGSIGGKKYINPDTIKQIYTNQISNLSSSTGLGWELNQPLFMGEHSMSYTFGKTGFTGCLVVADPQKKSAVVILSNHIHPSRSFNSNLNNEFRRTICDLVLK